jgi:lysophospholipase L1-like esterase
MKPQIVLFSLLALTLTACGRSPDTKYVLVIGDSISEGYTPHLKELLPEYAVVHNEGNARSSRNAVEKIETWIAQVPKRDVCTFNHGLHDTAEYSGPQTPIETYRSNLTTVARRLRQACARVIFFTTTARPVNETFYEAGEVEAYNAVAVEVMSAEGIDVVDLHAVSLTIPHLYLRAAEADDVHFTSEGSRILAETIAAAIE